MTRQFSNKKLQSIIQFMVMNPCVSEEQFQMAANKILTSSSEDVDGDPTKLYQDANKRLNPFNMMIRTTINDLTREKYYVLISTVDNDVTHAATRYNPKQIEFFKHLLQSVVHATRGIIPHSSMRISADKAMLPSSTKFTSAKRESESLFREWTAKKWFDVIEEDENDFITLGVRTMAELDVFIKEKLVERASDLDCKNCGTISIYSVLCTSCAARFHKRCAKTSIDDISGICRGCSGQHNSSSSQDNSTQNNSSQRRSRSPAQISTPASNRRISSATKERTKSTPRTRRTRK